MPLEWLIVLAAGPLSWILTELFRRLALRSGVIDIPNARSSHAVPTPRGGGAAVVVTILAGIVALWTSHHVGTPLALACLIGGGLLAGLGYLDDRLGLGAGIRLTVHVVAGAAVITLLGATEVVEAALPGWPVPVAVLLIVVAICWWLNLFNFMDGIDGIAAMQGLFVTVAAAGLTLVQGGERTLVPVELLVAAACLGFLYWNWAPARIFMGDVGSGTLGLLLAVLGLASSVSDDGLSIWTWVILGSLFIADASVTLIRRVLRGERWYEAHRSHAYQRLSRRWSSHARVTLAYLTLNFLLVAPLAVWSVLDGDLAFTLAMVALALGATLAALAGAGRVEPS